MDSRQAIPQSSFSLNNSTQSLPTNVQCSPIFVEYQLMKEFVLFQKQNLPHVYIIPSNESAFEWFGVMFIHNGLYSGKLLRFTVYISPSYPNCDVPKIVFDPVPIHPLVDETTGELNTSDKFVKWNSTSNFIYEVILFAKSVFEINNLSDLKKCLKTTELYCDIAYLKNSITNLMTNFNEQVIKKKSNDKNFINFTEPENTTIIDRLKSKLLNGNMSTEQCFDQYSNNGSFNGNPNKGYRSTSISGLSWTRKIPFN